MNARVAAPTPRTRLMGALALVLLAMLVLAGCSSSSDEAFSGGAEPASAADGFGGDAAADAAYAEDGDLGSAPAGPDRAVIITGEMYMTVDDPITASERAVDIVEGAGGRIDARGETAPEGNYGGAAQLTMRIPSRSLESVLDALRELGTVDELRTDSYDVTNEVTDLEARISTLRASTQRIQGLLHRAEDIEDIIDLEDELAERQARLESLEAQQRGLDDQVSMSTIHLSLTTEPVVIVDDSPDSFWDGLVAGWNGLASFVSGALVVLGVLLPWLAVIGLVAAAIVVVVRARAGAKARRVATPAAPATEQAEPAATQRD